MAPEIDSTTATHDQLRAALRTAPVGLRNRIRNAIRRLAFGLYLPGGKVPALAWGLEAIADRVVLCERADVRVFWSEDALPPAIGPQADAIAEVIIQAALQEGRNNGD